MKNAAITYTALASKSFPCMTYADFRFFDSQIENEDQYLQRCMPILDRQLL